MDAILALLVLLALAAWLWYEAAGSKERARHICRAACRRRGVQFLDDTVSLRWMRPGRNRNGRVTLVRSYGFEFSPDGTTRERGYLRLCGRDAEWLELAGTDYREYAAPGRVHGSAEERRP